MPYKILSLDGGGSWALIQARVLKDLYPDMRGHELLREFDLVIGNSGGSMVLAALCNDMSLDEIISIFENEAQRRMVFSELRWYERIGWHNISSLMNGLGIGPKYSTQRKREGLQQILKKYGPYGEMFMEELPSHIGRNHSGNLVDIMIAGFDYSRERATFFRSNKTSRTDKFSTYAGISLLDAIHASSNAPVNYFNDPACVSVLAAGDRKRDGWYWDGAVSGFNNPVLAAVIEAVTNDHGTTASDYAILSLGTGLSRKANIVGYDQSALPEKQDIYRKNLNNTDYVKKSADFGFLSDVKKISHSILSDPPDAASFIAYSILNPKLDNSSCLVRINPCITPELDSEKKYGPPPVYKDNEPAFRKLLKMDMDAISESEVALITELCNRFIRHSPMVDSIPNQLIRGEAQTVHHASDSPVYEHDKILGYPTYYLAKKRWEAG